MNATARDDHPSNHDYDAAMNEIDRLRDENQELKTWIGNRIIKRCKCKFAPNGQWTTETCEIHQ